VNKFYPIVLVPNFPSLINQFHIFSIQKEPECIPAVRPAGSWRETGGRMGSLQLFNGFIFV
jgi:hypothetical protein